MFQGSMVALVTPMLADGSVDYTCLEKLIEMHVEAKTDAIVAVGTTGESATLNFDEHCDVVRFVVEKVGRRLPVIAGTGANSTSEAIELGLRAAEVAIGCCRTLMAVRRRIHLPAPPCTSADRRPQPLTVADVQDPRERDLATLPGAPCSSS